MRRLIAIVVLIACAVGIAACNNGAPTGYLRNDVTFEQRQQTRLEQDVPNPVLFSSAERYLQAAYYTQLSDRNKLQYLELISLQGQPYYETTIKGPVANTSDQLTNPQQLDCEHHGGNRPSGCGVIGLPEPNGVYQGGDDTHFAITTTGAILKWNGNFVVSDQPFQTKAPVLLTTDASKPVSPTDTSHVRNPVVPGRR